MLLYRWVSCGFGLNFLFLHSPDSEKMPSINILLAETLCRAQEHCQKLALFRGQYTVYNCSLPCPGALSKTGTFSWPVHCQKLHFSSPVHCLQLLFPVPSTLSKNYPLPCPVHCSTIVICRGQYTVKQVFYISRAQYTVKKLQFAVVCTLSQIVHCCGQCTVKLLICRG